MDANTRQELFVNTYLITFNDKVLKKSYKLQTYAHTCETLFICHIFSSNLQPFCYHGY